MVGAIDDRGWSANDGITEKRVTAQAQRSHRIKKHIVIPREMNNKIQKFSREQTRLGAHRRTSLAQGLQTSGSNAHI